MLSNPVFYTKLHYLLYFTGFSTYFLNALFSLYANTLLVSDRRFEKPQNAYKVDFIFYDDIVELPPEV